MKIVTIIGARPQFIKSAIVSKAIADYNAKATNNDFKITEVTIHTGQHYDANMSDVFFEELEIHKPQYNLKTGSGLQGEQTGKMLAGIEKVLINENPDGVIVYGDTNSTLAGALAAAKLHMPVAHVEAGLRSDNHKMPEEINRILTDHISAILFCPTQAAVDNLKQEGLFQINSTLKSSPLVFHVGDVMYDAACYYGSKAKKESRVLEFLKLKPKSFCLVTVHRAENTDNNMRLCAILDGLSMVSRHIPTVFPLHPRTRKALEKENLMKNYSSLIRFIEPAKYLDMVMLEQNASVIVTDSGGVQKEAYFFKVPCVTLRDETEWTELLTAGWNKICPPVNPQVIANSVKNS